ncbi:MAG: hypothetical protein KVP17_002621 [Porospora cf. gigantea B]|nr:MAG: hypothetical protein KVP17_002621 [Porospora cf. gigantea B]
MYLTAFFFASGFEVVVVLALASAFVVTFVISTQVHVADGTEIPPLDVVMMLSSAGIYVAGTVALWIADRELEHLVGLVLTQPLIATDGYDAILRMEIDIPVARCERLMRRLSASWLSCNTLNNGIISMNAAGSDCMHSQISRPLGILTEVSPSIRPLHTRRDVRHTTARSRRNTVMKVFTTKAWATTRWRTRVRSVLQFCSRHCRYMRRPAVSFPLCEMPPCAKILHHFSDDNIESLYEHWITHHLRFVLLAHIRRTRLWMISVPTILLNLQFNAAFTLHMSKIVASEARDRIIVSALWCLSLVMCIGHLSVVFVPHRTRWVTAHGVLYWWMSYTVATIRLILVNALKTVPPTHLINTPLVEYLWVHLLFEILLPSTRKYQRLRCHVYGYFLALAIGVCLPKYSPQPAFAVVAAANTTILWFVTRYRSIAYRQLFYKVVVPYYVMIRKLMVTTSELD